MAHTSPKPIVSVLKVRGCSTDAKKSDWQDVYERNMNVLALCENKLKSNSNCELGGTRWCIVVTK